MRSKPEREPDIWAARWQHVAALFLLWLCGSAALVLLNMLDSRWDLPLIVVLAFYVSSASLAPTRRRFAYRRGWLSGRRAMIDSMEEAAQRGMTFPEWLESEIDRDLANVSRSLGMKDDLPEQP